MTTAEALNPESDRERTALQHSLQSLKLVSASLPHLAGLARICRLKVNDSVDVAAVGASGLIVVNSNVFSSIPLGDATFILAHELMHLALDTHGRIGGSDPLLGNYAHDYIINDMLCEEFSRESPPLSGLWMDNAREKSFEELVVELCQQQSQLPGNCWSLRRTSTLVSNPNPTTPTQLGRALSEAGLTPPLPEPSKLGTHLTDRQGDILSSEMEAALDPELSQQARSIITQQVRKAAANAASLGILGKKLALAQGASSGATEPERHDAIVDALRTSYYTPWQLALQRWMDAVSPGERSYARPSRRGADRGDFVLPGRRHDGWTLHVILDTSGSMEEYLSRALGAIAHFCESSGVGMVHIIQCDVEVTKDDWIEPCDLDCYSIRGYGYSDMSPAIHYFAEDHEITSVLMLTDGYIDIPTDEPPFHILWVLIGEISHEFQPPYGGTIFLPIDGD